MPPLTLLTDDPVDGQAFWGEVQDHPLALALQTDDPVDGDAFWGSVDPGPAVAAERLRLMNFQRLGETGVVDGLTFSDPLGLLSSYSLDPVTGIAEVTALPGVQTANVPEWAGWQGRIYGAVDLGAFATNMLGIILRIQRDTTYSYPAGNDLVFGAYVMNGPRATATYYFGGSWRHPGAADTWRPEVRNLRAGVFGSGASSTDQTAPTIIIDNNISNNLQTAARAINASGALVGGSANLGALRSNGTNITQAGWGTETWVFFGVGRGNGSGVAPDNTSLTARFLPEITYTAPDWTWTSINP